MSVQSGDLIRETLLRLRGWLQREKVQKVRQIYCCTSVVLFSRSTFSRVFRLADSVHNLFDSLVGEERALATTIGASFFLLE